MADRYTKLRPDQIQDDTIRQDDLDLTTAPTDGQIFKVNMPTGDFTPIDITSANAGVYKQSFTNASLSAGILTVTHSLNSKYVVVAIFVNNNKLIKPVEY